jgi:peroxiredoxin
LQYPLLADADKSVTKSFGILGGNGFAMRQTFVIDKKGVVRKIFTGVTPAKHADEVLAFIKENLK